MSDQVTSTSVGRIADFRWLVRASLDGHVLAGCATAYFGLGAEYGESRSWLDGVSVSDEGPHVFMGGGYLKAGVMGRALGPLHGYAEATQSVYQAHARRAGLESKFNWLGQAMEVAAGLRLQLFSDSPDR